METISAEKKKATDASTMVATLEERTRKAEDAVKMLQTDAHMSDNRIAELVQKRATRAELQIRDLSARCQHLQEHTCGNYLNWKNTIIQALLVEGSVVAQRHIDLPEARVYRIPRFSFDVGIEFHVSILAWVQRVPPSSESSLSEDKDVPGTESASSSSVAHVVPGSEIGSHKRLKEEVVPLVSSRQLRVLKHRGLGLHEEKVRSLIPSMLKSETNMTESAKTQKPT
eukprot:Em0009g539a